jgi:hypothetical protein
VTCIPDEYWLILLTQHSIKIVTNVQIMVTLDATCIVRFSRQVATLLFYH